MAARRAPAKKTAAAPAEQPVTEQNPAETPKTEAVKTEAAPVQEVLEPSGLNTLELWDSVSQTNPHYTKQFSRGGGFKGTSTNVTYQIFRATRLWGPMGGAWGAKIADEKIHDGAPLLGADGTLIGFEKIHTVKLHLWYPNPLARPGVGMCEVDGVGVVEQFGQTMIVSKNRNGIVSDEEAPKKSYSDAMSKCLSALGFSADIYLGQYDDNKYVNSLERQYDANEGSQQNRQPTRTDHPRQGGVEKSGGTATQGNGATHDTNARIKPDQVEILKRKFKTLGREITPQVLAWMKTDKLEHVHPIAYGKAIDYLDKEIDAMRAADSGQGEQRHPDE